MTRLLKLLAQITSFKLVKLAL